MANIRKTFNFRNGVQVDDDNLIVDAVGKVGIGTSVPTELLDVRGTTKVVGLVTSTEVFTNNLKVRGITTTSSLYASNLSVVLGVVTYTSGIVTYYGDGGRLLNLPTSQWLDVNSGIGFTSIYAQGFVGVATQSPSFVFQVGGNSDVNNFQKGVGLGSEGNVIATGILTAGFFVGNGVGINSINATEIFSGTLSNSRLPIINNDRLPSNISVTGIVTASSGFVGNLTGNVTGDVVGIATTARDLTADANISINSINSGVSSSGISTITTRLRVDGVVGILTGDPQANLHIVTSGIGSAQITSPTESTFTLGRSLAFRTNTGQLRFGNTNTAQRYSTVRSFDILNYDNGNLNFYLDVARTGINTGNFNWFWAGTTPNVPLMTLTYSNGGRLGLGITVPTNTLHVVGTSTVTTTGFIGQDFYVGNNAIIGGNLNISGQLNVPDLDGYNIYATAGISTFNNVLIQNNLNVSGEIGIQNSNPLGPLHVGNYTGIGSDSFIVANGEIGITTTVISPGFGLDCSQADGSIRRLGVTTTSLRAAVDFADAGANIDNTRRYMLPPKITATQRVGLNTVVGAIIFNTTADRLQLYVADVSPGGPGGAVAGWIQL